MVLKQCSRRPLRGTSEPPAAKKGRERAEPKRELKGVVSGLNPENHRVPSFVLSTSFFLWLDLLSILLESRSNQFTTLIIIYCYHD